MSNELEDYSAMKTELQGNKREKHVSAGPGHKPISGKKGIKLFTCLGSLKMRFT